MESKWKEITFRCHREKFIKMMSEICSKERELQCKYHIKSMYNLQGILIMFLYYDPDMNIEH